MPRGYARDMYVLTFDHRGSFETKIFGWEPPLSAALPRIRGHFREGRALDRRTDSWLIESDRSLGSYKGGLA
jgi:hypothetical protein